MIDESGLTPEPLYFVASDSSRGKGVIFNKHVHSLDSSELSADSAWVREGAFLENYVRLVKGEEGNEDSNFLEIFDKNFQKRDEIDLTKVNPDLSGHYLNTKHGLMFRAQDQPEEEVMYYDYLKLVKGNN